jgi:mono/diheme cytochrome c family protein
MRPAAAVVACGLALAACRQDMHDQPKYKPLAASTFFADGRSARPRVEGTVPLGALRDDPLLYTGKVGDHPATELPFPVDRAVLERGRSRFDVYCTPCHDRTGSGEGMVVRRGFRRPPSFHTDRLRGAPVGHFFDVITNGFGVMQDYAAEIAARDRWAIVAYVRALQLAENARPGDAPPEERARLAGAKP